MHEAKSYQSLLRVQVVLSELRCARPAGRAGWLLRLHDGSIVDLGQMVRLMAEHQLGQTVEDAPLLTRRNNVCTSCRCHRDKVRCARCVQ